MKASPLTSGIFTALPGLFLLIQGVETGLPESIRSPGNTDLQNVEFKEGHALFTAHCVACHQEGGGGIVGFSPNIRNRDFLMLASDEFIRRTIQEGRPGTAMVARPDLTEDQIDNIISYLRTSSDGLISPITLPDHPKLKGNREQGKEKFNIFCSSCHGGYGEGYVANVPGTGIGLPGFLNVASDDYILTTLTKGRIGTPMQPFIGARGLANLSNQDAFDIIAHLRHLGDTYEDRLANQPVGPGNPQVGEIHFNINCAACHQTGGIGKVGFAPSIRNRDFLMIASDLFIKNTISKGREGTGMLPRPDLPEQTVNDIIAYLRQAQPEGLEQITLNPELKFHGDAEIGKTTFTNYCASCHGEKGEGYVIGVPGPGIGLKGFLSEASDDYIYQTLKRGRAGTPMRSFLGSRGLANLDPEDLHNVIAYLRVLENEEPAEPEESSAFE